MKELDFEEKIIYYPDDFDSKDQSEIYKYRMFQGLESRKEYYFRENYNFTDRKDVVVADEFGCTHAPSVMIDNYRYFEENLKSIFKLRGSQGGSTLHPESMINIYENPLLVIQIKKDIAKIKTLENIINLDSSKENKTLKNFLKELNFKGFKLETFKEVAVYYLRFSQSPYNQTLRDWKNIKDKKHLKEYINLMFEMINYYQDKIKNTWE